METVPVSYYCRTCGSDVGSHNVCDHCGGDPDRGNAFCHYCGNATSPTTMCETCYPPTKKTEISKTGPHSKNLEAGSKPQSWKWQLLIIPIFVVAGILIYNFEVNRKDPKELPQKSRHHDIIERGPEINPPVGIQSSSQPMESKPEMQESTSAPKSIKPFNGSIYMNNSNSLATVILLTPDSYDPTKGTLHLGQGGCKFKFKYELSDSFSSSGEEIKAIFQSSNCGRSSQDKVFYYVNFTDEFYTIIEGKRFYFERVGKAKVSKYDENGNVSYGQEDNLNQESLFDN